ncbi:MAG: glutamate--tRNA ligase [Puniceicoccaceae bacterium]|nr:MAG: glutamate--tRNA ligase [Puniceicoccaceae bacterium]
MNKVRVRFAPSPTGFFHIGSARTALFNWLYARARGGVFILRIEDTDRTRNTSEALRVLFDGMRWLGLDWDEGPEAGGGAGPYFQSQRDDFYRDYREKLVAADRAYEKEGALFFRISGEPQVIEDAIRGRVERTEEKDFVIFRSDGSPVFHFVNVVDDIAMGITHVIRGEDHLSNTSKHTELFKAFGVEPPTFAHIPLILKQNGPGKMSKRDEGALIEDYQRRGFLPEAVVNYLCLLGWSPKDDREKMPIEEIIRIFDLPGINRNNARFDERKMRFLNAAYLQEIAPDRYLELARAALDATNEDSAADPRYREEVFLLCREKIRAIDELPGFTGYFFTEDFPIEEKAARKILGKGEPITRLRQFLAAIGDGVDFSDEVALEAIITGLAGTHGVSTGEFIHPIRLAVSGTNVGPGLYGLLRVLGRDRVVARIERFLAAHG